MGFAENSQGLALVGERPKAPLEDGGEGPPPTAVAAAYCRAIPFLDTLTCDDLTFGEQLMFWMLIRKRAHSAARALTVKVS